MLAHRIRIAMHRKHEKQTDTRNNDGIPTQNSGAFLLEERLTMSPPEGCPEKRSHHKVHQHKSCRSHVS